MRLLVWIGVICASLAGQQAFAAALKVDTPEAYRAALKKAQPGDRIVLANGVWRDFEIVFKAQGKPDALITLEAEDPGKVILSGKSSLQLAGEYLHVRGLVFRDGYTPNGEVVSFRRSKQQLANHSRVSEVVIDHYNQPDRFESDYWVAMYGRNNRFDHNHLVGKTNAGVTMAVRLDADESRNNQHRIDHNYFGPRPVLGSNGGETLRIGTSAYSMFDSNTTVEHNVFDRCSGEVEIISSKSGGNIYRGNLFLASEGTLTLRHGDRNRVEDNVFLGQGQPHTGGIRVINRDQVVRNNYMEGLRGDGFASALTVMNGVPNSPVNRYVQVANALIENNTVVDSRQVGLATGRDAERSAPPVNSRMTGNLLFGDGSSSLLSIEDDISGLHFENNWTRPDPSQELPAGIATGDVALVRASNGLLYPEDPAITAGVARDLKVPTLEQTGVDWYAKPGAATAFGSGAVIHVEPGQGSLSKALAGAADGATLQLGPGSYDIDHLLTVDRTISIVGPESKAGAATNATAATLRFSRSALFELRHGARLRLADLQINGEDAPDSVGNSLLRTATQPPASNVAIVLERVSVRDFQVNAGFNVITAGKGTLIDELSITDSEFVDISGAVVAADVENDDYGRYNVDRLEISGSRFERIGGPIASVYRGGTDESTFGPEVELRKSTLRDVGRGKRSRTGASLHLHGVQIASIRDNRFSDSAEVRVTHTVGEPRTEILNNEFSDTPPPVVVELNRPGAERAILRSNKHSGSQP